MRTSLLVAALLASVASCGVETDDRPVTAEYLTAAIFRPQCGSAACHSSATARRGVILDTVDGACTRELNGPVSGFLIGDGGLVSGTSRLARMPLDAPLPTADINLIAAWEDFGPRPPGCPQ